MYLTRTRAKFVSCSWSFTCSKYPVYPRYRVTAIESSAPLGRVERESPTTLTECVSPHSPKVANHYIRLYRDFYLRQRRFRFVICHMVLRSIALRVYYLHQAHNISSRELKAEITRSISRKFWSSRKLISLFISIFISSYCSRNSINSIESIVFSAQEEIYPRLN